MSTKDKMGMTPKQIVAELDRFIIGQADAKKAVAIALRNRYRRKFVSDNLKQEIVPKNILMIGPTGVGKTEIARRLAKLANAPFIKVEATKFTEIGYVGRDVEGIIRDLTDISVNMFKYKAKQEIKNQARESALERIIDVLVGTTSSSDTRDKFRTKILNKEMENIGERRLHTVMEKLVEEISYNVTDMQEKKIVIDEKMVTAKLNELSKDRDLARFVL